MPRLASLSTLRLASLSVPRLASLSMPPLASLRIFSALAVCVMSGWACGDSDTPDPQTADSLAHRPPTRDTQGESIDAREGEAERSNLVEGTVEEHRFRTRRMPHLEIRVDPSIPFFGTTRFPLLQGRTDAEIALFADVADSQVNRFCAIQTEAYRDTAEGRFRRAVVDTTRIGTERFYLGYFCFDLASQARARPETDIAGLLALIESKKTRADSIYVGVRMARPLDPQNRSEILLLYGESVRLNGIDCTDEASASAKLGELRARGISAFTGVPIADSASIGTAP